MPGSRSKNLNKKFDQDKLSRIILKRDQNDDSIQIPTEKQNRSKEAFSVNKIANNSSTNIPSDKTWPSLKHPKESVLVQVNTDVLSKQSSNTFQFDSRYTSSIMNSDSNLSKFNVSEKSIEPERILDREFQSLDIDADGYVSLADLQSVLKNFSHLYDSDEILLRIFNELDVNKDKRISKQEFQLYKNALVERDKSFNRSTFEEKLHRTFVLFDRDQDNYISPHEIRETMHNLGEHIDDNLIEQMMQIADIDHDGRISRDEFQKLLIHLHSKK